MRTKPGHHWGRDRRGLLAAGAVCAAAGAVRAQDCLWTAVPVTGAPNPTSFRAVFDGAQSRSLLVGITSYPGPMQIWAAGPAGWTLLASGGGPGMRTGHALAYDSARGRLVLFGGQNSFGPLNDTWEWDGVGWTFRVLFGPTARADHTMVFDVGRARCVLFGGSGTGGLQEGTWEWDGDHWTVSAAAGPSLRGRAVMAYDSDRGRSILFAGFDSTGQQLRDTWEWDGVVWVQRSASTPVVDTPLGLVYDPTRRRSVMVAASGSYSSETWEYEGVAGNWSFRTAGGLIAASYGPMVFDTGRGIGLLVESASTVQEWRGSAMLEPPWITQQPPAFQWLIAGERLALSASVSGTDPIAYQWYHDSTPLSNGGNVSVANASMLVVDPIGLTDFGSYRLVASNGCGTTQTERTYVTRISRCYANCDLSTTLPFLNVLDFSCYIDRYAAGCLPSDCYVNCDGSTTPPVLNVLDFQCYLNAFAAGCSEP